MEIFKFSLLEGLKDIYPEGMLNMIKLNEIFTIAALNLAEIYFFLVLWF